jgi:hypothetical protein
MFVLAPWSLARRTVRGRRAVLLLLLAALLYGFGLHAARACSPAAAASVHDVAVAGGSPCHGEMNIDVAEAACEAHCRTDVQSGRASSGFDLPAAVPLDLAASPVPPSPVGSILAGFTPARRDSGPPLHILLHRLLR